MARLVSISEISPSDFAWSRSLIPGAHEDLYEVLFDEQLVIHDAAVSRPDVELLISVGHRRPYVFCGPWMTGELISVASVFRDAALEKRDEEAGVLWSQLKDKVRGLMSPVIVPVRMPLQVQVRSLAKVEVEVMIYLRVQIIRQVY